mmetsp:Transcript_17546/g.25972  ORF Transcript_17546/g.25972 Transcript_17546/m.25972 type:complete len:96 (+) Transcript_17546:800-1087(+)
MVTHREGVCYFAYKICRNSSIRSSTPYCCIGNFGARVKYYSTSTSSGGTSIKYSVKLKFYGVTPFECTKEEGTQSKDKIHRYSKKSRKECPPRLP